MRPGEVAAVLAGPVAQRMLGSPLLARIAYNGLDGAPRVVPIGYVWTGAVFVMCTATEAPKVRALRRDPNVALTIDTEDQPPNILLVRGTAQVEVVDGVPEEFLAASAKGIPHAQWSGFEAQTRATYPAMARITVTPAWAKLIDFERTLPQAVQHLADGRH
jgi:hypothetical protein